MTVLVTGGAGYIGSHMALALLAAGRRIVVLDDLSAGFRWMVPSNAAFVEGDCGDSVLLARLIGNHDVQSIIHFAGSIVVPHSIADPLGYYLNNTVKSRALLEAAVRGGVKRFIFSSTAAVYGEAKASPISEEAPLQPISPYGSSKMMTETMLNDASRAHGLAYAILRYFNVAGADPEARAGQASPEATHLIKVACQAALGERTHLELYGNDYPTPDGSCVRDYIHVSDLADAHLLALEHLEGGGENLTLNCGYGAGSSVHEVVAAVKRASGVDFSVRPAPRRAGDPAELVADADRIRSVLGWRPRYDDLGAIVAHALGWEEALRGRKRKTATG